MYSSPSNSWYSKVSTGSKHGITVNNVILPETSSTEDVLKAIKEAKDVDGIQLMWPLPAQIDSDICYEGIPPSQDVDGLVPASSTIPITVDSVLILLKRSGVEIEGKDIVVLGRSRIVGKPLAEELIDMGGTVTVLHSLTNLDTLSHHLETADVVISCVGLIGVVDLSLVKEDCAVVGVGKSFNESGYGSDLKGEKGIEGVYSKSPGGVGPLCVAVLMRNVVEKAKERVKLEEARSSKGILTDSEYASHSLPPSWYGRPLTKTFHFNDHASTLPFLKTLTNLSDKIDHHPNIEIKHKCKQGVDVTISYGTYVVGGDVTSKDFNAVHELEEELER